MYPEESIFGVVGRGVAQSDLRAAISQPHLVKQTLHLQVCSFSYQALRWGSRHDPSVKMSITCI
jgi:hypothetical protein